MSTRSTYNTKQREELLNYIATMPGVHFKVSDICDHFKSQGKNIGTATVYRHLERMVDEGIVNKYIFDSNSPACFEYIAKDDHCEAETCFHCKCEKCGKLIHLHCDELAEIQAHLQEQHSFTLDPLRTVFYGLCEDCR